MVIFGTLKTSLLYRFIVVDTLGLLLLTKVIAANIREPVGGEYQDTKLLDAKTHLRAASHLHFHVGFGQPFRQTRNQFQK